MKSLTTARISRSAFLVALTLLTITAAASAAGPRWVQVTPYGGSIVALAQAPSAPQIVYAVGGPGLVFRSADGGATWRQRSGGEQDALIEDLIADPFDAQTVYGRTGAPLLRTRDGGLHWSEVTVDFFNPGPFAVDSRRPGVVFAGTAIGLYRSDDRGDTWSLVAFERNYVEAIAVDPREPATLFAAARLETTEPLQIWKSADDGATWTATPLPEGNHFGIPRFVFDPARPGTLYLLFVYGNVANSLLRSTDGGASWSDLGRPDVRDLAAAPDGVLYAATDRGVLRSTDAGATWLPSLPRPSSVAPPADSIARILVSPSAPGALLAAGAIGIWRSGDGGESWESSNRGLRAQGAYSVAVAPTEPSTVVAIVGGSIFRSTDLGASWIRAHSFLDGLQPYAILAVDPRRPERIYGFDSDGLSSFPVRTANGGFDWIRRRFPYSCDNQGSICDVTLTVLALDPHDTSSILVAGSYFFHFVGQGRFLLRSEDGLKTWTALASPPELSALVVDPERRDTYYALACGGFFRSRDAGATWQKAGRGLPERLCQTGVPRPAALALDPRDSQRIYVGTVDRGVFVSSDGGATFRAMNRGLGTAQIATLLIDPDDPARLYAGVPSKGVFQWQANRRSWAPLNRGLPLQFFDGVIALDPRHPEILYAASQVYGLFRLDLDDPEP